MWNFIVEKMKTYPCATFFNERVVYTYSQIINMVIGHGKLLKSELPQKAKCAILCDSGLNCALAIFACWYANLVPIPMSINYGIKHCCKIIELTEPDMLIVDTDIYHDLSPFWYNLITKTITVKNNIISDAILDDIAIIMCTSGTTGTPKGVMITEHGLQQNILKIVEYFDINSKDRIMIARPLYHCAVLTGELLISINNGLDIGFFDDKYNPNAILPFTVKNAISVLCGTPTLLNHLSTFIQRNKITHLIKNIAISGECLSETIAINIRKGFPDTAIYSVYGLTEASPRVSYLPPEKFNDYPDSVGVPLTGIQIKITDENQNDLPIKSQGLIMVETPCIMKGYYKNDEITQKVIKNNWLSTGDVGYINEMGYLYILSRIDDMIIKSGMNIYPKEIENQIVSIEQIQECVVYGVDSDIGQAIALDLVLNNTNKAITKKELMILLAEVLPAYQMPSEINILDSINKNASGKIVRPRRKNDKI